MNDIEWINACIASIFAFAAGLITGIIHFTSVRTDEDEDPNEDPNEETE